jgi:hypothetical protein
VRAVASLFSPGSVPSQCSRECLCPTRGAAIPFVSWQRHCDVFFWPDCLPRTYTVLDSATRYPIVDPSRSNLRTLSPYLIIVQRAGSDKRPIEAIGKGRRLMTWCLKNSKMFRDVAPIAASVANLWSAGQAPALYVRKFTRHPNQGRLLLFERFLRILFPGRDPSPCSKVAKEATVVSFHTEPLRPQMAAVLGYAHTYSCLPASQPVIRRLSAPCALCSTCPSTICRALLSTFIFSATKHH